MQRLPPLLQYRPVLLYYLRYHTLGRSLAWSLQPGDLSRLEDSVISDVHSCCGPFYPDDPWDDDHFSSHVDNFVPPGVALGLSLLRIQPLVGDVIGKVDINSQCLLGTGQSRWQNSNSPIRPSTGLRPCWLSSKGPMNCL